MGVIVESLMLRDDSCELERRRARDVVVATIADDITYGDMKAAADKINKLSIGWRNTCRRVAILLKLRRQNGCVLSVHAELWLRLMSLYGVGCRQQRVVELDKLGSFDEVWQQLLERLRTTYVGTSEPCMARDTALLEEFGLFWAGLKDCPSPIVACDRFIATAYAP